MNVKLPDLGTVIVQIKALAMLIAGFVLALLMLAVTTRMAGHPIPYIPAVSETALAYAAGAYWLMRK